MKVLVCKKKGVVRKDLMDKFVSRFDILNKVKQIALLPETNYATVKQVARYYEVNVEVIEKIIFNHGDELQKDGYKFFTRKEILQFLNKKYNNIKIVKGKTIISTNNQNIVIPNRGLRLFSIKSIFKVATYLTNSIVAEKVRHAMSLSNDTELLQMLVDTNFTIHKKQREIKKLLFECLSGVCNIEEEKKIGNYRADFLIDGRIIVECDEFGHKDRDKNYEKQRESFLKKLGYKVIRVNPDDFNLVSFLNTLLKTILKEEKCNARNRIVGKSGN